MRYEIPAAVLALALLPVAIPASAKTSTPPESVPYDADLFRKNKEVFSLSGEFLYWTIQEGALDYAQKMGHQAPTTSYAIGRVKSASFNMDPGVRCSLSYFNAPKYWEVRGQYTHLMSRGKDRAEKPDADGEYLTGTWPHILEDALVHAHSSIEFKYNLFDLSVDRIFIPNPHLRLRMVAGLGAAWIAQDWKVQYFNATDQQTTIRNRWHYAGGGMKIGLTGDWFWGSDFYLTGLTSIGIYMGSYRNKAKQTASTDTLAYRNSDFSDTRPAFTAQFNIGPSWQKNFTHNRVEVFAGYELSAWFNLQEIRRSTSGTASVCKETWINTGIIALQGLTTRVTLDF